MKRVTLGRFAFQYRSKAEWEASQLILYAGELAVEGDTGLMKVGDGKHLYMELPYFNRGEKGDQGIQGEKGETGAALAIKGTKNSTADLPETGEAGDAYMINGDLYVWSDTTWTNVGRVKGEKGDPGRKGDKGDPPKMTISDAGTWVVEGVDTGKQAMGPKGEQGDPGKEGKRGLPMRYDDMTQEQKQDLASMVKVDLSPYAKKSDTLSKDEMEENFWGIYQFPFFNIDVKMKKMRSLDWDMEPFPKGVEIYKTLKCKNNPGGENGIFIVYTHFEAQTDGNVENPQLVANSILQFAFSTRSGRVYKRSGSTHAYVGKPEVPDFMPNSIMGTDQPYRICPVWSDWNEVTKNFVTKEVLDTVKKDMLTLGETSTTAYRGDRGKIAYDHSQSAHAPADALNRTGVETLVTEICTNLKKVIDSEKKVKRFSGEGYTAYKCESVVTVELSFRPGNYGEHKSFFLPEECRPVCNVDATFAVGTGSYYDKISISPSGEARLEVNYNCTYAYHTLTYIAQD